MTSENEFLLLKTINSSIDNHFYCLQGYTHGESSSRMYENYLNNLGCINYFEKVRR